MTELFLNNKRVYFIGSKGIKMTKNNPYLVQSGTYSLEIEIPLDIPENLEVFGPLQRIEVSKNPVEFSARMISSSKEIFNGTASLTNISELKAKIQLLGGNSEFNILYGDENIYIDELPFEDLDMESIAYENGADTVYTSTDYLDILRKIRPLCWVKAKCYDANNDAYINGDDEEESLSPNLIFCIRAIIHALGYSLKDCYFDTTPFKKLYVMTGYIHSESWTLAEIVKGALPHWSVVTFFEELQRIFNCTVRFNETEKNVSIILNAPSETTVIEVADEFESEIDEEQKANTPSTCNLQFECSSEDGWDLNIIPTSMHEKFEHKIFGSLEELREYATSNPSEAARYLLHCPQGTAIYDTNWQELSFVDRYGTRYIGSSEQMSLKIGPSQLRQVNPTLDTLETRAVVNGPKGVIAGVDITPYDVLHSEETPDYVAKGDSKVDELRIYAWTIGFTEQSKLDGILSLHVSSDVYDSLYPPSMTLGDLFKNTPNIKDSVLHRFSFIADAVPDISNMFLIKHKKYIAKKIEYTIKNDCMDNLLKGEFYELTS